MRRSFFCIESEFGRKSKWWQSTLEEVVEEISNHEKSDVEIFAMVATAVSCDVPNLRSRAPESQNAKPCKIKVILRYHRTTMASLGFRV